MTSPLISAPADLHRFHGAFASVEGLSLLLLATWLDLAPDNAVGLPGRLEGEASFGRDPAWLTALIEADARLWSLSSSLVENLLRLNTELLLLNR